MVHMEGRRIGAERFFHLPQPEGEADKRGVSTGDSEIGKLKGRRPDGAWCLALEITLMSQKDKSKRRMGDRSLMPVKIL